MVDVRTGSHGVPYAKSKNPAIRCLSSTPLLRIAGAHCPLVQAIDFAARRSGNRVQIQVSQKSGDLDVTELDHTNCAVVVVAEAALVESQ